jgi:hypothetical protein
MHQPTAPATAQSRAAIVRPASLERSCQCRKAGPWRTVAGVVRTSEPDGTLHDRAPAGVLPPTLLDARYVSTQTLCLPASRPSRNAQRLRPTAGDCHGLRLRNSPCGVSVALAPEWDMRQWLLSRAQPAACVMQGERRGSVLVCVEEPERPKMPVDRGPGRSHHCDHPAGRDPGKGADRIPKEFDVIRLHPWPCVRACSLPLCDVRAVWAPPTSRSIGPPLPLLSMTALRRRSEFNSTWLLTQDGRTGGHVCEHPLDPLSSCAKSFSSLGVAHRDGCPRSAIVGGGALRRATVVGHGLTTCERRVG